MSGPIEYGNAHPHKLRLFASGGAALSADERTIAFSTLDHSIVTSPLNDNGPILTQKREFANRDRANWSPRVPVVLTSEGIVLGGTASGEVPIISTEGQSPEKRGDMSVIRHGEPTSRK